LAKLPGILVKALGRSWWDHEFAALNERKTIPLFQLTGEAFEVVYRPENNAPF
jgi:hypothetical protein